MWFPRPTATGLGFCNSELHTLDPRRWSMCTTRVPHMIFVPLERDAAIETLVQPSPGVLALFLVFGVWFPTKIVKIKKKNGFIAVVVELIG